MINLLSILGFVVLLTFAYGSLRGAPWVPTKKRDVERFLKLSQLKPGQKMVDLGCGDGRLLCVAAQEGAKAQGFEVSLLPYFLANLRRLFHKDKSRIKISYRDVWQCNLSDADLVYVFLMPKIYPRLKQKFENELKPSARVIAYVWPIQGWEPVTIDSKKGCPNLYLYQR